MNKEEIIYQAIKRFDEAQDAYAKQRQEAREDLKFVAGEQWSAPASTDELRMTVNLLQPFLRQITSDAREANPSIKVVPAGNGADEDLAEVIAGLIKHIEQKCDAVGVYQQAVWYAAASGEGYLFIDSEYCSDDSFEQDLVIKGCSNPEKVFLDPHHELLDGCDAEWGFVIEDIDHDVYVRQFPRSRLAQKLGQGGWDKLNLPGDWVNKDIVRVAKYWVKEYTNSRIFMVIDPQTGETITTENPPDDAVVLKKRNINKVKVKCYMMTADEVLDEMEWPGKYIPIIKVTGDSYYVGGRRIQHGAIRMAKDPQRQYNYFTSRQTEMIDLAPKNSFVGATEQFANNPEKWANANRINYGFLDYTPVVKGNTPVPPPTRVSGLDQAAFQGVMMSRSGALEDLKLVFGLHDAALGRPGNEISGVAIEARNLQSRKSTYQYFDNLLIALKCLGRQLVELIPYFYDTDRTIRIVKPDTTEQLIAINSIQNNMRYDLTKGTYDVIVTTGPAFASKRQEALSALSSIMQAMPQTGAVIGDLVASQVDNPVSKLAAARIKATIPKEVLAATGELDNQSDMAPAEALAQAQQMLSRAEMELQKMQLEKQELEVKIKVAEDKAAIELTKSDMEHERELAKLEHERMLASAEMAIRQKQLELQERQLEIKEKELQLHATMATHKAMNEDFKMEHPKIGNEANLGGSLD